MEKFQKELIAVIQSAFSGKPAVISGDFDWQRAVTTAKSHNIAAIVYYGAINSKIDANEKYMVELNQLTLRSVMTSTRQMYEVDRIENMFEKENIEYMPLKGLILKKLYPKPEMRTMGDADILIKTEQYAKIKQIMEQLQFSFRYESNHELVWYKTTLLAELHKSIMTSYNEDFYGYFGDGWKIAKSVAGNSRYEMSTEDFYIFAFVHFTKHYRISGIGIKHLIDLWVYANAHPEMNMEYIKKELGKMHLTAFYENIKNTIDVWFCGGSESDVTNLITSVIFNSGQYGSAEMAIVNRSLQKGRKSAVKIKISRVVKSIFPGYKEMKEKYGFLKKAPYMLPIMWIVRGVVMLTHGRTEIKSHIKRLNGIDSEQFKENSEALRMVGLEFKRINRRIKK